eukprot:ANDGO_01293.mRNA.1 Putative uncharacterized protein ART2
MIGRADIEGSKSNVAMSAWLPQASYPCGNFSDTSSFRPRMTKGSIGHAFTVWIRTENQNQMSFYPFVLHEISVLIELILGHLRYRLTDVPPQPNSPPDNVLGMDHPHKRGLNSRSSDHFWPPTPPYPINDEAFGYLKRVIVTPAVYPRLVEFLHFDIQSTGQKSHFGFPLSVPVLNWLFVAVGRLAPDQGRDTRPPNSVHLRSHRLAAEPLHPGSHGSTFRANPSPEVTDLFCRLPLPTLF